MRNWTRFYLSALTLAALVFSLGCNPTPEQKPPVAPAPTQTTGAPPPEMDGPTECTIKDINDWIGDKLEHGPLAGQSELKLEAVPYELTTHNEKGVPQTATYPHLLVSGKVIDRLNGNMVPTFPALNGIIQPLIKNRGADRGPCVTAVKYVQMQTRDSTSSGDFMWSYCPVGTQVCANGTCSEFCTGKTGGIGR